MTHHAYVYEADTLESAALPDTACVTNVDVAHVVRDRFSIDDARILKEEAATRPVAAANRQFVILTKQFTFEAQNALLKLIEEPPHGVVLHIIVPQVGSLLPTVRSRVSIVTNTTSVATTDNEAFTAFQQAPYKERIAQVAALTKAKDLATQEAILRGCEEYAAAKLPQTEAFLREVVAARRYLTSAGASRKMILESLALSLGATPV